MQEVNIRIEERIPYFVGEKEEFITDNLVRFRFSFDREWGEGLKTVWMVYEDGELDKKETVDGEADFHLRQADRVYLGATQGTELSSKAMCLALSKSIRGWMLKELPAPEVDIYGELIEKINQLPAALSAAERAEAALKKAEELAETLEAGEAVLYTAQTLTAMQKEQARANISAVGEAMLTELSGEVENLSGQVDELSGLSERVEDIGGLADTVSGLSGTVSELSETVGEKVDRVPGKGLSENDYTTADREKLGGIEAGAQKNPVGAAGQVVSFGADGMAKAADIADVIAEGGISVELSPATAGKLGGVMVGDGLSVDGAGKISVDVVKTAEAESQKPITAGAVYEILGDLQTLLGKI